jgi:hypothetical protein
MQRFCDEVWLCFQREIFRERKCVYKQHQCNIETVYNEIKSSSNDLLSATKVSDNCGKMCQSQTLHQYNPTTIPPPKRQQHNHLHHFNIKFSQHSIFRNCRNSIVHFLASQAETNPMERRSESRCRFFVPSCFSLSKGHWLNHVEYQQPLRITWSLVTFRVVEFL